MATVGVKWLMHWTMIICAQDDNHMDESVTIPWNTFAKT